MSGTRGHHTEWNKPDLGKQKRDYSGVEEGLGRVGEADGRTEGGVNLIKVPHTYLKMSH